MSPGWSDDTGDYRTLLCKHINKAKFLKCKERRGIVPFKGIKEDN